MPHLWFQCSLEFFKQENVLSVYTSSNFSFFFFSILKKQKKQKQDLDHWCDEENGKWFLTLQALIWLKFSASFSLNCDILHWTTHGEEKEDPWFLMFLHKIFELHIPKPDDLEFVKVHSVVDKGIRNTERNIKNIIFFKIKGVIR